MFCRAYGWTPKEFDEAPAQVIDEFIVISHARADFAASEARRMDFLRRNREMGLG